MDIVEIEYKQRAYDDKWQVLGKIIDHENSYTYLTETKQRVTYTPEKWITLAVYDLELEFVG